MKKTLIALIVLLSGGIAHAVKFSALEVPAQPILDQDPGSAVYPFTLFSDSAQINGREVDFFAPSEVADSGAKIPLIVFGHGQAIGVDAYRASFEHLAKKGVAVLFLKYDTGFFDQDWERMGHDYVQLTELAVKKYSNYVDPHHVIYSGHSKGGYIALAAAGVKDLHTSFQLSAVVVFEPAGYVPELLKNIDSKIPVTLTFAESDTIIKESLVKEIYDQLPVSKKQLLYIKDYRLPNFTLAADHFFPLSRAVPFIGGNDGISPLHYFGTWKWLMGAAWDATGVQPNSTYLYGDEALSTGIPQSVHKALRSW